MRGIFWDIKNLKEMTKNGPVQFLAALYNSIDIYKLMRELFYKLAQKYI
jgi:hypothetical protein